MPAIWHWYKNTNPDPRHHQRCAGQETVEHIRSLKGRDIIRQECQDKVNERLLKETGKTIIRELIFYQLSLSVTTINEI